jgi:hypothetical protein
MQHHACDSRDGVLATLSAQHCLSMTGIAGTKKSWEQEMSTTIDSANSRTADPSVEQAQPTATDNRAEIAREIATAKDPETLKNLVFLYILEVTRNVAIPGDRLRSIEKAVIALRRQDRGFPRLVREQRECLTQLWQAQGRSHEVWDKLAPLIRNRDWAGVKVEVANQLKMLAKTSTTKEAVQAYKDNTLLACGLNEPNFRKAVEDAVSEFLTSGPANAASEIARLCDSKGPETAAKKLRELTDPARTTPLEAALILNRAKPTIDIICRAFGPINFDFQEGAFLTPVHIRMFSDLAAAVDSASRSVEGAQTIEQIGGALCRRAIYHYATVEKSVADGNLVLPLEMLKQLRDPRDRGKVDWLSGNIKDGLAGLRASVEQSVLQFAKTVQPMENPAANWDALLGQPFKTAEQTAEQWVAAHPDFMPQAQAALKALNTPGYQMIRAIAALNEYLPQLPPSRNVDEMRKLTEVPENSAIAFAQAVSRDSVMEAVRLFNAKGLHGIALMDPNKIVPDPSWSVRAGRNNWQQIAGWRTGTVPFGFKVSAYGTVTYLVGVGNRTTEWERNYGDPGWMLRRGWRVGGFKAMYLAGTAIEGMQVVSIVGRHLGIQPSENSWRRFVAQTSENVRGSLWQRVFSGHIRLFGWFNVAGTVNYLIQGDYKRAGLLFGAAGGTLLSSYASKLGLAARLAPLAGPVGTALVVIGSTGLVLLDIRDRHRLATQDQPYNEAYLRTAGLRPEIAKELAKNDSNGLSAGPKLEQLAKHLRVTPQELLQYLNAQNPNWVRDFVWHGVHAVEPNQQGQYPASRPGQNLRLQQGLPAGHYGPGPEINPSNWRKPHMTFATTLEGIVEWAALSGHQLPRR